MPQNKLQLDPICPLKICRKGKEALILKDVPMIDPITRFFGIMQYSDNKLMKITDVVETT